MDIPSCPDKDLERTEDSSLLAELDKETPGRGPCVEVEQGQDHTQSRHHQVLHPLRCDVLRPLQVGLDVLHEVHGLLLQVGVLGQVVADGVESRVGQRVLYGIRPGILYKLLYIHILLLYNNKHED